jgi:hypothetical protein
VFIGHFAVAFAAKRSLPRTSLAVLFAAVELADLLWPAFVAVGLEQVRIAPGDTAFTPLAFDSNPYSHSLVAMIAWGLAFGYIFATRGSGTGRPAALLLAALVVSHWVLDVVSHRPDMPVYPGGPKVGLGLWYSVPATIAVETSMFAAAVAISARATRPRDGAGRWGLAGLVALLMTAYAANIAGGPPPSVTAIVIAGVAGSAVILALAWWMDAHREVRFTGGSGAVR